MSKYDGLGAYLRSQAGEQVPMTFAEIERITGVKLPPSSRIRAWWSNNATNSVMTKVWLAAGFRSARVDMARRKLVFQRERKAHGMAEDSRMFVKDKNGTLKKGPHPLIGSMKGTFTIEPGWDLTKPAFDPEELAEMEANLDQTADMIEKGLSNRSR